MYVCMYVCESCSVAANRVCAPVEGVIFDMDGTLTMPGAINFNAMYERCGLSRSNGDIVLQIENMTDLEAKTNAYKIIIEEEMIGVDNMALREDMFQALQALHKKRIRTAIATRNCDVALNKFLEVFENEAHRLACTDICLYISMFLCLFVCTVFVFAWFHCVLLLLCEMM